MTTLNRTGIVPTNDSGAGTDGTIWNAAFQTAVYDAIDNVISNDNVQVKSANYTAVNTDDWIICVSGSFTVTLHAANDATRGFRQLIVTNQGTGQITVSGPQTINGQASIILLAGDSLTIKSTGAVWLIV